VLKPGPQGTVVYYVYADHLNTPRAITDTNNNLVWRWDNGDPFGVAAPDQNPSGQGIFEYNLRFPGQIADKETYLVQNGARDYDAMGARYVQSDPIGLAGGINTYAYVEGNPISYTDPLGLVKIYEGNGVSMHSYPGPQAGGNEHARHGPGENYHIHVKDSAGREVRISTETWKPLTPEDQRIYDRSKAMQNACQNLTESEKKFFDRINRQIFHRGGPTINQLIRMGGGMRGVTRGSD
ncbi:MAG: hypothetical protein JWQ23_1171, partial [Herminiimonas sp.]|nr:hypothetical protein [Herminiimonas sp.]